MRSRWMTWLFVGSVAVACSVNTARPSPFERNTITAEEIAGARGSTAWDVIQELRPEFLRGRGPSSVRTSTANLPVVYLDAARLGAPSQLRTIAAASATSIEFISAADATTRWGTGHSAGVIHVRTHD